MHEIIGRCPVCSDELKVTELACGRCGTKISGDFCLDKLSSLNKEKKYFVEIFLKNRGNIKEIEKEMGISYPTVRKLLDEVIVALGYSSTEDRAGEREAAEAEKAEILRKLSEGEIDAEEAAKRIKAL